MQFVWSQIELLRDFFWKQNPDFTEKDFPDLKGKVYIVTGASSGIGYETARLLAGANATVYITGRTPERIAKSLEKLRDEFPNTRIEALRIVFDDLESIKPAVQTFLNKETRLDGVIHNAGIQYTGQTQTKYGYIDLLVVNVFAPQLLQRFLDPLLIKTARTAPKDSVRIVWVSSSAHLCSPGNGGIDWDNLNEPADFFKFGIYGQSKTFNIYQAALWAKHHPDSGVVSVSAHPGVIKSDIRRSSKDPLEKYRRPTIYGAYAEIYPLLNPTVTTAENGTYFAPFGRRGYLRGDIAEAVKGPQGEKVWDFIEDQIKPYL